MILWIKSWFCEHEWELVGNGALTRDGVRVGHYHDYVCEKCLKKKGLQWIA
jgi:hypothetical protein